MRKKLAAFIICIFTIAASLSACSGSGNTDGTELEEQKTSETLTEAETEPVKTSEEPKIKADSVDFEIMYDDTDTLEEYAVITGFDSNLQELWSYTTDKYPCAQLSSQYEIGTNGDAFYFVDDDTLKALSIYDGSLLWENSECLAGVNASDFTEDGEICISHYFSPDLLIFSPDGEITGKIDSFFEGQYMWTSDLVVEGNYIYISGVGMDSSGEQEWTIKINKDDLSYTLSE